MRAITILLIEDNLPDVRLIREMLKDISHFKSNLISVLTLKEGCEQIQKNNFDIILLDLNLPDSTGRQTFQKVIDCNNEIPVVLITGMEDEKLSLKLIMEGAQDYITKQSLNPDLLGKSILYSIERQALLRNIKIQNVQIARIEKERILLAKFPSQNPGPILRIAGNGKLLYINEAGIKLLPDWQLIINEIIPSRLKDIIDPIFIEGTNIEFELTHREFIYSFYAVPFIEDGYINLYGRDITERKRAEKELAEKEFFLRESQRAGNIGSYETNFVKGYWQSSETLDGIFGIDKNYDRSITGWLEIVHPDDRQNMDEYLRLEVIGKRKSLNKEYRIVRINDKQTRWVHGRGDVKFDDSANVTDMIGTIQDITERKRAEEDLTELNQLNKQVIQNAQDGIIVYDLNMRYLAWNPYMEKITGMPASQVLGKHPSELFPFLKVAGVIENIKKSLAGEIVTTSDFYFNIPGTELSGWAFDTNAPLKNSKGEIIGVIGVVRDITERKNAEESLFRSEADLRAIFENTDTGFYLLDNEANIIAFNKIVNQFIKLSFGFELQEKQNLIKLFAPESQQQFADIFSETIKGSNINYEINYPQTDGAIIWYSVSGNQVLNPNGKVIGVCVAVNNITERKLAELQLKENEIAITNLNENLKKRAEELAVSNEELERYAYVTSHDLQEPLRMVTNFLQLLQKKYDQQLDATAQKYINFAVDGAARMKTLILNLLEFSRISSVKQQHTIINLNDVAAKTRQALKAAIDESQATINVPFLPEVCGNESQLLQLFQNLISNAIKYKSNLKPVIEIGYTETPGEWQFYVQDNGIGIDKKFFKKIFIIFQRLHNRKEYEGTGIGLAICKKIVELHGGKIWIESSKEHGSKFYFTILKLQTSNDNDSEILCPGLLDNT